MPSREQSAEAHPTRSRRQTLASVNAAIFNVHATRAPRRLRRSKKKLRRYQALMSRKDIKEVARLRDAPIQPAA